MARTVEVEWQLAVRDVDGLARWLARARFEDGWTVVRMRRLRLRDAYYDTADWRIARTHNALRVRRGGGAVEVTMKAFGTRRGGVARRRELTECLRDARLATLRAAPGRVGRAVRHTTGTRPLRRLFGLDTRRDVYLVRRAGRDVAELVLDRTRVVAGTRRARVLQRLEVEVTAGSPALVGRFVAALKRRRRLGAVTQSKFGAGLTAARLRPPRR